jgi:hypothetical protein
LARRDLDEGSLLYLVRSRQEATAGLKGVDAELPPILAESTQSSHAKKQDVKAFLATFPPPTAEQIARLKGR